MHLTEAYQHQMYVHAKTMYRPVVVGIMVVCIIFLLSMKDFSVVQHDAQKYCERNYSNIFLFYMNK